MPGRLSHREQQEKGEGRDGGLPDVWDVLQPPALSPMAIWCDGVKIYFLFRFCGRTPLDTDFSVLEEKAARVRYVGGEGGPSRALSLLRQQGHCPPLGQPLSPPDCCRC